MVVLFHAGIGPPGGYIGVDVFFVVSGFVISRRFAEEASSGGSVDLAAFYRRRVRRLLPAMAVFTVVTTLATAVLLSPFGLQQRAFRTGGAATLLVANVQLYRTTGYFDRTAALNPFLHTWSLSVEEQVFLLLPALLLLAARVGRNRAPWRRSVLVTTAVLSLASFALALTATSGRELVVEATARLAFFAMPTRLWEFGAGVLVAMAAGPATRGRRSSLVGLLGLATVIAASFLMSPSTAHPGPWTAVVVAATATVLAAGKVGGPASSALSWRPLAGLGDVSYGWYLWHWPALVFCAVLLPASRVALVVVAIAALVPAALSHRFIERPVRTSPWWTSRRTVALGLACVAVPLATIVAADRLATSGWGLDEPLGWYDYPPSQGTACHLINRDAVNTPSEVDCRFGPTSASDSVMVVGDELANGITPGVVEAAGALDLATVQRSRSGCPFLVGVVPADYPRCSEWQAAVLEEVEAARPSLVVIANQAPRYLDRAGDGGPSAFDGSGDAGGEISTAAWSQGLRRTIDRLQRMGIPTIVVGSIPDFGTDFPRDRLSVVHPDVTAPSLDRSAVDAARREELDAVRSGVGGRADVALVDPVPVLCSGSRCDAAGPQGWRYLGPVDLTASGARQLSDDLQRAIDDVLSR